MDIESVKKKIVECQAKIEEILDEFQKETGCFVNAVDVEPYYKPGSFGLETVVVVRLDVRFQMGR